MATASLPSTVPARPPTSCSRPRISTEDLLSGASFVNFGSIPLIREPVRSATHRIAELARER